MKQKHLLGLILITTYLLIASPALAITGDLITINTSPNNETFRLGTALWTVSGQCVVSDFPYFQLALITPDPGLYGSSQIVSHWISNEYLYNQGYNLPSYTWTFSDVPNGTYVVAAECTATPLDPLNNPYGFDVVANDANMFENSVRVGRFVLVPGHGSFTVVNIPAPIITTTDLQDATITAPYSQTLSATDGSTPYTWSIISGSLPLGLSLNPSTGEISGTPTSIGTASFTVQVEDANNSIATKNLSITVFGTATYTLDTISDTYLKQGQKNKNQGIETLLSIQQSGNHRTLVQFDQQAITDAVGSGTLISATLETTIQNNGNNWGATGRTVDIHRITQGWTELGATWNCANDTDTSNSSPDCLTATWDMDAQDAFSAIPTDTQTITNGLTGTVSYDITADIQSFLLGANNYGWIIKKTEEGQAGSVELDSKESSSGPTLILEIYTSVVTPPSIITTTLNDGFINILYSQTLQTEEGLPPLAWSIITGSLPSGLSLNPLTGEISGTPTIIETTNFTVQVEDANNSVATKEFNIVILDTTTATLQSSGDTYLKQGQKNKNQGAELFLRVRQSGNNRTLIQFNSQEITDAIGSSTLAFATLEATIQNNGNNWGSTGRTVDIHRMTQDWTELGATWNCANDTDTSNSAPDCPTATWDMDTPDAFLATPTDTQTITNGLTGTVSYDVTADIQLFLLGANNYGWIIKKTNESQNGRAEFDSRETANSPRLILKVSN